LMLILTAIVTCVGGQPSNSLNFGDIASSMENAMSTPSSVPSNSGTWPWNTITFKDMANELASDAKIIYEVFTPQLLQESIDNPVFFSTLTTDEDGGLLKMILEPEKFERAMYENGATPYEVDSAMKGLRDDIISTIIGLAPAHEIIKTGISEQISESIDNQESIEPQGVVDNSKLSWESADPQERAKAAAEILKAYKEWQEENSIHGIDDLRNSLV
jgi:hypothetical protein